VRAGEGAPCEPLEEWEYEVRHRVMVTDDSRYPFNRFKGRWQPLPENRINQRNEKYHSGLTWHYCRLTEGIAAHLGYPSRVQLQLAGGDLRISPAADDEGGLLLRRRSRSWYCWLPHALRPALRLGRRQPIDCVERIAKPPSIIFRGVTKDGRHDDLEHTSEAKQPTVLDSQHFNARQPA